ncbi:integration host factor subunit alpha [Buchnera aphidicola (Formosaphis micheliae)]|uniref:integration host factor subunit alpha n=1 Tax=Buchnera aphidicola TaxID=9 RepID=UPI0031B8235E
MVFTKAKLLECLFESLKIKKKDVKNIIELFFKEVCFALEDGEKVKLSGFGNFDLRYKEERPGRNPKTGEKILIKARRIVVFKPGKKLKNRFKIHNFN